MNAIAVRLGGNERVHVVLARFVQNGAFRTAACGKSGRAFRTGWPVDCTSCKRISG